MKVARIYSFGGSDQIKIEDSPTPKVKNGEVLVRIHDAGINPIDWKIREGFMKPANPKFPLTLGQDFSGEVMEVGDGVKGFHQGDRIFGLAAGSYAEYAIVHPDKIARMPDSLDYKTAASIPTAGLTAWQLVIEKAQIKAGQTILIHGAAGGVGSIAAQLAIWKKANVVATASAGDAGYLKRLGVQKIVDYQKTRFEEVTKNVDIVIDLVGGDTLSRSYQIMKKGGMALSTVGGYKDEEAKSHGVHGLNFVMSPSDKGLADLAKLFDKGILKVRKAEVLPLMDAKKAQDLNQKGQAHGKVILRMM